jgi:hypothetical protein
MTDDQTEALIALLERLVAIEGERLELGRRQEARSKEQFDRIARGEPPQGIEAMQRQMDQRMREQPVPPVMERQAELLERIATALESVARAGWNR